jgi:hypothetical protein
MARTNLAKDENGDLLADSHNILNRQNVNVHRVSDVTLMDKQTVEPPVPGPSPFEAEIAIAKFKKYKLPGTDQIMAEPIPAGGKISCSDINELINSIWKKEEFNEQWKESIVASIYKKGDKSDCSKYQGKSLSY